MRGRTFLRDANGERPASLQPCAREYSRAARRVPDRASGLVEGEAYDLVGSGLGRRGSSGLPARGYYCASVGAVDEKTIRNYIETKRWDEDVEGFKITAPTEP
jgi:REP element-mobilizing transposase RayT